MSDEPTVYYEGTDRPALPLGPCGCICVDCLNNDHCDTASCATLG